MVAGKQTVAAGGGVGVTNSGLARSMKQTPFLHRNSNPCVPMSEPSVVPSSFNAAQELSSKMKKHKLSKSRELHASTIIYQMNVNSSLTSKNSQLRQENVFSSKRKSHGSSTHQQTRGIVGSTALKRRSSGGEILGSSEQCN